MLTLLFPIDSIEFNTFFSCAAVLYRTFYYFRISWLFCFVIIVLSLGNFIFFNVFSSIPKVSLVIACMIRSYDLFLCLQRFNIQSIELVMVGMLFLINMKYVLDFQSLISNIIKRVLEMIFMWEIYYWFLRHSLSQSGVRLFVRCLVIVCCLMCLVSLFFCRITVKT